MTRHRVEALPMDAVLERCLLGVAVYLYGSTVHVYCQYQTSRLSSGYVSTVPQREETPEGVSEGTVGAVAANAADPDV